MLLAPEAKRREAFGESHLEGGLHPTENRLRGCFPFGGAGEGMTLLRRLGYDDTKLDLFELYSKTLALSLISAGRGFIVIGRATMLAGISRLFSTGIVMGTRSHYL